MTTGPEPPQVTVVVCTLNRAAILSRCLDALAAQDAPPGTFEVVVVDNGSVDGTPALLAHRVATTPHLRTLRVEPPGLARARNAGTRIGIGAIAAYIDDDGVAAPGWVTALLHAFAGEGVVGVAGRSTLVWPARTPRWVDARIARWYSAVDLGDSARDLEGDELPVGVNMAVQRSVFDAVGGFDEALGRVGDHLRSSEDDEFFRRVAANGGRLVYEPNAAVQHLVAAERASLRWLARRAFAEGATQAQIDVRSGAPLEPRSRTAPLGVVGGGWRRSVRRVRQAEWFAAAAVAEIVGRTMRMGYLLELRRWRP